jgi:hypothetical protein
MSIKANYLASTITDDAYPLAGRAVAASQNFQASGTILIGGPRKRSFLLSSIVLLTAAVAGLSNGSTVVVTERDSRTNTAATLSTSMSGTNNDIVLTARTAGTAGNDITLALIDPSANNAALSVAVTGTDIVVNLATGAGGAITTTATQLLAAIAASTAANALVSGALKGSDNGGSAVTALAETALSGGLEWTVVQTLVASTDLADSDSVGKTQALTLAAGIAPLQPGNEIAIAVTAGTSTTDLKDVIVAGTVF